MNINKIVFAGNITRDPELKSLPTGTKVVNFSIASNSKYKNKNGEMVEQTEFGNIVMFDKKAEAVAKYLKKGDPIYVEGKLQTRSWEKDGVKMYRTEIIANEFQFVGGNKNGTTNKPKEQTIEEIDTIQYPEEEINLSDIPF